MQSWAESSDIRGPNLFSLDEGEEFKNEKLIVYAQALTYVCTRDVLACRYGSEINFFQDPDCTGLGRFFAISTIEFSTIMAPFFWK